jgi:hypothetical protein
MQQRCAAPPAAGQSIAAARYDGCATSQQSARVRQVWPTPEQHALPPPAFGTMHEELPMQHRLESEHGASGPEHAHALPEQAALQHCEPSAPADAPHVADATPGWRQQAPAMHATVVS